MHQFYGATAQHIAQIDVVRHRLNNGSIVGDVGQCVFNDDGDLGAVFGHAQAGIILVPGWPIAVAVVIQVAAILAAE
ncbi:hypothetical protein D3C81_1584940 [compost metagenome]